MTRLELVSAAERVASIPPLSDGRPHRQQDGRHTVSIEFRHESWPNEAHRAGIIDFFRELNAVYMIVDGPQGFANSVPLPG